MSDDFQPIYKEMSDARELSRIKPAGQLLALRETPTAPPIILAAGANALFAWDEFFAATIRNRYTRAAYGIAVRRFFRWLEPSGIVLQQITPGMVGSYLNQHQGSPPTRKLHLAALRRLFDLLVTRHAIALNPAASVRTERYQVIEGKTPQIAVAQVRDLLTSIDCSTAVGLRDRAVLATLIYTAARAGAVAKLRVKDFRHDGSQWSFRFAEKGGKSREIPLRHDLEVFVLAYGATLDGTACGNTPADGNAEKAQWGSDTPLFRTADRRTGRLTGRPMTNIDICRMMKRRLRKAGLPAHLSPHSFRVATITDLLCQGVPLEDVQHLAGHADPRTTRLYDRRHKRVTRNIVERISI